MASKRKLSEHIKPSCKKSVLENAPSEPLLHSLPKISSVYQSPEFIENFGSAFKSKTKFDSEAIIYDDPFLCCVIPNFIQTSDFLHSLKNELLDLEFKEKNNDLYSFAQTNDLKTISTRYISSLKTFLENETLLWLKEVTGIPLDTHIDITSSRYEYTDVLLCHDDELEGRRIAYMLYLVPPWNEEDGGALDLFNIDDAGEPKEIVKSLFPKWNNFVFFEVTEKSYHQVSEILSEDKIRLSVNGWFYGPSISRSPHPKDSHPSMAFPVSVEESLLKKWVSASYFRLSTQAEIRAKFEEESEIELTDFLNGELYKKVAEEIQDPNISWQMLGPPNKRHYEMASENNLPPLIQECIQIFKSDMFFLLLSSLTGLKFHPSVVVDDDSEASLSTDESTASNHLKLTRWKWKSYSLMYDSGDEDKEDEFTLDAYLFFNCSGWKNEHGGFISYIADEDELLSIHPNENSLALIYRDSETKCFVKYANKKIEEMNPQGEFHSIIATYKE